MKNEYLRALEIQSEWLRFGRSSTGLDMWRDDTAAPRRAYDLCLSAGECVYVNAQFCRLITEATPSFPGTAVFRAAQLPAPAGFVYFDQQMYVGGVGVGGWNIPLPVGLPLHIAALGWVTVADGVQFMTFVDGVVNLAAAWLPYSYLGLREGDSLEKRIVEYESKADRLGGDSAQYDSNEHHELRIFYALLALMNQRLVTLTRAPVDRHAQRRAVRAGREAPGHVRVVEFRRKESHTRYTEVEQARAVDWQCRWIVRGHWRKQWYASRNRHEPKWIESYLKGPARLPVRDDVRRVFAVVR